jgi:hypothetical protein
MKQSLFAVMLLASTVALAQGTPMLDVSRMPFSQDSIQQVMQHHKGLIQECYEEHLATKAKKVEGKLMTSFTITGLGLVKNAKVLKKGTTLKDKGLHDCVVAALTSMSFPKPPDGLDHPVEYPFNLKAIE